MALVSSGQVKLTPLPHAPIRQLLNAGRNDEAISLLTSALAAKPYDLAARELMFDAQFQKRSWNEALAELEILRKAKPDSLRYRTFLISTLSNMKRYSESAAEAKDYLAQHGENIGVLNNLKVAYFYLGKIDEAVRCGQRVLELHDAEAWRHFDGAQLAPSEGRTGKSVISFSLWGRHAAYNYGALINMALARKVYPGWMCRFYVGADVPQAVIDRLLGAGAEVVPFPADVPPMYARFLPLADPAVARFLSRDTDSRLNEAEAESVSYTHLTLPTIYSV